MIDLSIILPAIRIDKWAKFVCSVIQAANGIQWEVIFVGPHAPPIEVKQMANIKYIESKSSPVRCIQLGSLSAQGEYLSVACDDGIYLDGSISSCFKTLDSHQRELKFIVSGKYMEGHLKRDIRNLSRRKYYMVNSSPITRTSHLENYVILNLPFIKLDYFKSVGGLDCRFEVQALAMTDLANRVQQDGAVVSLTDDFIMDISPSLGAGNAGDHGPVYYGQTENDVPLYRSIYDDPTCKNRISIDFDNWKQTPEIWHRRFK